MAFSDLLSGAGEGVTCTAFTLDGTVEMDETGAVRKLDHGAELRSLIIMGTTMSETAPISQTINNCDDGDVTIHVPEDDAAFREVSDIYPAHCVHRRLSTRC